MLALNQLADCIGMFELNGNVFVGAAVEIGKFRHILSGIEDSDRKHEPLTSQSRQALSAPVQAFRNAAHDVGARMACVAADRLLFNLQMEPCTVSLLACSQSLNDIESRFADHLTFIKLFVIPEDRAVLFSGADNLLKSGTASLYTSLWFDCEEAAKCLCVGRSTASVFHTMRMLEIAIAAISSRLGIPNPSKADRSWGNMLQAIKTRIDQIHPKIKRSSGSEGAKLEEIYVSLDAVKNPWRNSTMHVDSVYTEEEARHILACTSHLLDKMAEIFDETGNDAPPRMLALS